MTLKSIKATAMKKNPLLPILVIIVWPLINKLFAVASPEKAVKPLDIIRYPT
jgi:hypothetical protein